MLRPIMSKTKGKVFSKGTEEREIVHEFTQWTSMGGVPHIGNADNKYMIIFWFIVTVTSFVLMVWQVWILVSSYLEFEVAVGMEVNITDY